MTTVTLRSARMAPLVALCLLGAGCGDNAQTNDGGMDISVNPPDLAGGDFSVAKPDLSGMVNDLSASTNDLSMEDLAVSADLSVTEDLAFIPDLIMRDITGVDQSVAMTPHDFAASDLFVPGDPGLVDAVMDGPGKLADGSSCTGVSDGTCGTCLAKSCNAQMVAAFGANWATTDANSTCAGVYACSCTCQQAMPGKAAQCLQQCSTMKGNACLNAFNAVATCLGTNCGVSCM